MRESEDKQGKKEVALEVNQKTKEHEGNVISGDEEKSDEIREKKQVEKKGVHEEDKSKEETTEEKREKENIEKKEEKEEERKKEGNTEIKEDIKVEKVEEKEGECESSDTLSRNFSGNIDDEFVEIHSHSQGELHESIHTLQDDEVCVVFLLSLLIEGKTSLISDSFFFPFLETTRASDS